jgi:parallel beta-helix repeat protein
MTRNSTYTPLVLATVVATALTTLTACSSDSVAPAVPEPTFSAQAGGKATLVVDDDRADCPRADFNRIQAAVLAAQPGDKILVCRGEYAENVVVEKADLRIEAQGAPGDVVLQGPAAQSYGFWLLNTTGVLVQGFTVQGYADANIIIDGGSGNTLRKNVSTAGVVDGIEVKNSRANVIEHNVSFANAAPNADGIFVWRDLQSGRVDGASDNIIRHNETFSNGQHGINLFQTGANNVLFGNRSHHNRVRGIHIGQQSNENAIDNNQVFANGSTVPAPNPLGIGIGILVINSTGMTITNNQSHDNGLNGIAVMNASGNVVRHNRSENNGANGIAVNMSTFNVVSNNRSESNRALGINLTGASDNLVEKNEVFGNGQDGIRIQNNSDRNTVRLNHALRNSLDGIRVLGATPDRNTIERNVMRQSGEHDAHDDSVGPGTAGTANVWVKNHCETESRAGLCERAVPAQPSTRQ